MIPIGEFSQMTRLSLKALRLYDSNGLLPAARVDPSTGYRYYEPVQANRAEAIRVLRSVDMPLDEIKAVLAADSRELVTKHLAAHRERLVERLAADERMLSYLDALMQRDGGVVPYSVELDEVAPRLVAATRFDTRLSRVADDVATGFGSLVGALGRERLEPSGPPFMVLHDVIDAETDGELELCLPVARSIAEDGEVSCRQVAGGQVAVTEHRGPYLEIAPAYHVLTAWIAAHGYEVTGPPREIYLNDAQAVAPGDLVTRVEFPVAGAGSDGTRPS